MYACWIMSYFSHSFMAAQMDLLLENSTQSSWTTCVDQNKTMFCLLLLHSRFCRTLPALLLHWGTDVLRPSGPLSFTTPGEHIYITYHSMRPWEQDPTKTVSSSKRINYLWSIALEFPPLCTICDSWHVCIVGWISILCIKHAQRQRVYSP